MVAGAVTLKKTLVEAPAINFWKPKLGVLTVKPVGVLKATLKALLPLLLQELVLLF